VLTNLHTHHVVYLSPTVPGQQHDKKMADEAQIVYPRGATLGKDTGFQGYTPSSVLSWQPRKKPCGQALTTADRFTNKLLATVRIGVEHVLAGVKRSRMVKDVFRNTQPNLSDMVMAVACALHNLRMTFRHPLPTFSILPISF
jgi:hypothetical protein